MDHSDFNSNAQSQSTQSPVSSSGSSRSNSRQVNGNTEMTASTISHLELPPSSTSTLDSASVSPSRQRLASNNRNYLAPPGSSSPSASIGDDSALDALLLAHDRDPSGSSDSIRSIADDTVDSQQQQEQHHYHDQSRHHRHHIHHPKGTTAETGAPTTTKSRKGEADTIPTVSSTGMPRFLPRRTSNSSSSSISSDISEQGDENVNNSGSPLAPSGSLLLAAFSSNSLPISRRISLIVAAMAVNLGLPFLNGVMLGFGEIFARAVLAPMFGLAPSSINVGGPGAAGGVGPSPSDVGPRRPTGSGVGIGFNASRIGREQDGSWTRAGTAQLDSVSLGDART